MTSRRSSSATSTLGLAAWPTSCSRSNRLRNSSEVNRRRTSSTSQSPITQSSGVDGQRDVGHDLGELLVERQALGARLDVLLLLALQLIGVGQEPLHGAELVDQLRRGLVPHPGNAGDVVAGVALQRDEVEVLGGRDAEPLVDRGFVVADDVADALAVEHHRVRPGHQLEEVPVGRDDRGVDPLLGGPRWPGCRWRRRPRCRRRSAAWGSSALPRPPGSTPAAA